MVVGVTVVVLVLVALRPHPDRADSYGQCNVRAAARFRPTTPLADIATNLGRGSHAGQVLGASIESEGRSAMTMDTPDEILRRIRLAEFPDNMPISRALVQWIGEQVPGEDVSRSAGLVARLAVAVIELEQRLAGLEGQ